MGGITAYGAYVPYHRLELSAIAATLGTPVGRGTRAVASYDEDTTSMGVEAGRTALSALEPRAFPERVYFATAAPAYLDKTNASAIYAALGLARDGLALDMGGAVRSGVGAMLAASEAAVPTIAVLSDIRGGLPGGADERDGGDAAAAFVFGGAGDAPVLARVVGSAATSEEFLDRWRLPGAAASRSWEERFGESVYVPLLESAFAEALKNVGWAVGEVDHLVVAGVHSRAQRRFIASSGVRTGAISSDFTGVIGNSGTAHAGVLLADVLDRAGAGERIAVVVAADGGFVLLLETTEHLAAHRSTPSVAAQVAAGRAGLSYPTFLSWRGLLVREGPRRPDPEPPAAPPAHRSEAWKFAFVASRCEGCGTRHLPPSRVCLSCHAVDQMRPEPLADVKATIATFTIDRLAYTPSPPLVAAVLDFDGGGRFRCQLTDVDPDEVAIGQRVEPTFRRIVTAGGIHNYFWKARPLRSRDEQVEA